MNEDLERAWIKDLKAKEKGRSDWGQVRIVGIVFFALYLLMNFFFYFSSQ